MLTLLLFADCAGDVKVASMSSEWLMGCPRFARWVRFIEGGIVSPGSGIVQVLTVVY